jgi:ATP-dependent DNA ligase
MDEVMNSRGEGLVIKHPESEYVLNGRNRDWIKVRILVGLKNEIIKSMSLRLSLSIW